MKKNIFVLLTCFTLACSSTPPQENTTPKTETSQESEQNASQRKFDGYTDDFKKLMISFKGDIREIPLYVKPEVIQAKEKATLIEQSPSRLVYKLELNATEHATITYGLGQGQLQTISILVKMDTQEDYQKLEAELIDFFTHKFGSPTELAEKGEVWNIRNEHEIDIIDRSDKNGFVLEVDIQ